jgi:hypothetical protein
MAAKGEFVYQLPRKIDVLAEAMAELEKIEKASRPALAENAGIQYRTLQSAISSERVTTEVRDKLAAFCEIDLDHPTWIDKEQSSDARRAGGSRYEGADTADNFRSYVRTTIGLRADPERLLKVTHSQMLNSHIATISVSDAGQAVVGNEPIAMFLQIDLSPSYDPSGYGYGFKKVRIRVLMENAAFEIRDRLGREGRVQLSKAWLTARGTDNDPFWELAVDDGIPGILSGECSTTEQHLCRLFNGQIGAEFRVELSAQLYDGSLTRIDGVKPEPRVREAIVERLLAKRIGDNDKPIDHGWLTLGMQTLRIVKSRT